MAAQDVKFKHVCLKIIETDFLSSLRGKSDDRHVHRDKLIWNPVWAVQMMISTNLNIQSKSYFSMTSSLFIQLCQRTMMIFHEPQKKYDHKTICAKEMCKIAKINTFPPLCHQSEQIVFFYNQWQVLKATIWLSLSKFIFHQVHLCVL